MAFACLNAAAQFVRLCCGPDRTEIIVVFAQVAHGLRTDTARPDIAIGGNLCRCNTSHAGDNLPFLHQRTLHNVVVAITERLRNTCYALRILGPNIFLQTLNHRLVLLIRWGNAHANRVQLDALFGDLTDELIGFEFFTYKLMDSIKFMNIEVRDNSMDAQGEVFVLRF